MRLSLFAAAALGPLCLVAAARPALALDISGEQKTSYATSASGDITVTTTGSVNPAAGPAITLDSDNSVTNNGTIGLNNVSDSTVVLIQGGHAGAFTNAGTISNIEDYNPRDDNSDGIFEAPLAAGVNRYTVRVTGSSPFTGAIKNSGSIFGEGNDSVGLFVEAPLNGSIENSGTIGVTGDRAFGLRTTGTVSGDILLGGPVSTSGKDARAVSIEGDVGGALKVYSTISSNAYSTATRVTTDELLKKIQGTPSEVQQAGSPLAIGANLARGLYIGAAPVGTASGSTADADADGVPDGSEGSGGVSIVGSAPGVLVGSASRDVSLGAFGTGDNAYGMIVRGSVSAAGLYDGVTSTAIQVGGLGHAADVAGGLRLTGVASATSYEADATVLRVGAGGVLPELRIENGLSASVQRSGVSPAATATATGVLVEQGGSLSTLTNYGTLAANAVGPTVSASAVVDRSGTLSRIENQGVITATLSPSTSGEALTGRTIALDLRANTSGVTLHQAANPSPIALAATTDAAGNVSVTSTTPTTPSIVGDVLLGSGPNTVDLQAGSLVGALDLGSNTASLTIGGGASYSGALSHTGGGLTIDVADGSLTDTNPATLQAQSLNVGPNSTLSFAIDPANGRSTSFQVAGTATIADGAKIGTNLVSNLTSAQTYNLITAQTLTVDADLDSLLGTFPYVTIGSLSVDEAAGTLDLDIRRRSAEEAGLNAGESAALPAVYAALGGDAGVQDAIFSQLDREGFIGLYDQMLPNYSGSVFRLASLASRAASRASAERGPGTAWVSEFTVASRLDAGSGALPNKGLGFGVAGGLERQSGVGLLGVNAMLYNGEVRDRGLPGDSRAIASAIQGAFTWRADFGRLRLDAQAGGGYFVYKFKRQFIVEDADGNTTLSRTADADAHGWSLSGRLGASYRIQSGRLFVQPDAHLDYFRLSQGAYTETGGGDAFNLAVAGQTGKELSGSVSLRIGATFGEDFQWRPEVEVGYRNIFSGKPGSTVARFAAGGDSFTLAPAAIDDGGAFASVSLGAGDQSFDLSLGVTAEQRSDYTEGDLHVRARLLF